MTLNVDMEYPATYSFVDGEEVRKDDIVWLNEGTQVGFIYEIITKPDEWGLEKSDKGVMIQSLHPLDAREKEYSPGLQFVTEEQFEDEGIGRLSSKELHELDYAVNKFFEDHPVTDIIYTVDAAMDMESKCEYWHISIVKNGVVSHNKRIKFREGTRYPWD